MRRLAPCLVLKGQRGATALETAIILIAFMVAASALAWVVLSAGLFTTQKSGETLAAGIDQVTSGIEISGDPKADGVMPTVLSPTEQPGAWVASLDVTASTVTTDRKEGSFALDLTIDSNFTTGLVAYENLGSGVDLSGHYAASLWIKSSSRLTGNVVQLILDDSPNCGSPEETLAIPALATNTWEQPRLQLKNPAALTAVACVGLTARSDPGALTFTLDLIQGPPEVHAIYVNLNNSIPTRGVAFVPVADTGNDGLLSDEADQRNNLVIVFSNQDSLVRDLAWTVTELGAGDGDEDLDYAETFMLKIDLRAVVPIPTAKTLIDIEVAAHGNAMLVIERFIPRNISTSMILR